MSSSSSLCIRQQSLTHIEFHDQPNNEPPKPKRCVSQKRIEALILKTREDWERDAIKRSSSSITPLSPTRLKKPCPTESEESDSEVLVKALSNTQLLLLKNRTYRKLIVKRLEKEIRWKLRETASVNQKCSSPKPSELPG